MGVPPGTFPSCGPNAGGGWSVGITWMATSCWRVPEDPHPHRLLSAPDTLGKGGEPSRATAPLGESVPVSPRRTLSPSHCPIHPHRLHMVGKAFPVVFPHCSHLPSQPYPAPGALPAAGAHTGWAGAPQLVRKQPPKSPLSSPNPPRPTLSCCCPQQVRTSIPQTSTFLSLEKPIYCLKGSVLY